MKPGGICPRQPEKSGWPWDEPEPATLAGADIVLADDHGSAGAAVKVDDILDATPMTSETSVDATPAVAETFSDGLRCAISAEAINLSAADPDARAYVSWRRRGAGGEVD